MDPKTDDWIARLQRGIDENQSYEEITGLFRNLSVKQLSGHDQWRRLLWTLERVLVNYTNTECVPGTDSTKEAHVRACVQQKLKEFLGDQRISWSHESAEARLLPFFEHIVGDEWLLYFVFDQGNPVFLSVIRSWLMDLEARRERPSGWVEGMECFVALERDFECLGRYCTHQGSCTTRFENQLNWDYISTKYLRWLDDEITWFRAGAARLLGKFFAEQSLRRGSETPSLETVLRMLGEKERSRAGVLGPFIDGFDQACQGPHSLDSDEELSRADFEPRRFILDVLRDSGFEDTPPGAQALWFYVHEYFRDDPEAVEALIEMHRPGLALMAATEESHCVEGMEVPLRKIAALEDSQLSHRAALHLRRYY